MYWFNRNYISTSDSSDFDFLAVQWLQKKASLSGMRWFLNTHLCTSLAYLQFRKSATIHSIQVCWALYCRRHGWRRLPCPLGFVETLAHIVFALSSVFLRTSRYCMIRRHVLWIFMPWFDNVICSPERQIWYTFQALGGKRGANVENNVKTLYWYMNYKKMATKRLLGIFSF